MNKKKKESASGFIQKLKSFRLPNKYKSVVLTFILDIAFAVAAYFSARAILYYDPSVNMTDSYKSFEVPIAIVFVLVTVSMLVFFDCYNTVWKYAGRVEFFKVLLSYIADFGVLMLLKVVMKIAFKVEIWATLILLFLLFSALLSIGMRFFTAIRNYIKHVRKLVDDKSMSTAKRTVVIGAGYTGSLAINRFINNPHEGYFPVALVDDDVTKQGKKIYGIKVDGGLEDLDEIVFKYKAETIVIAIMSITKPQLKNIYLKCVKYNIPIKIMPAITNADEISYNSLSLRDIKIDELLGREEFKVHQNLIDSSVKGKVVLVTGGAGSIGSELCRQSLNFGCKHLVIFDQHENGMFQINQEFSEKFDSSRYSLCMGTVRERVKLKEVFDKYRPEVVFHAAAYKHVPMMEIAATEAIKNNVFGTRNVIEESINHNVGKFVLISTDKAVNPANVMGASKRIAEMIIEKTGKNCPMKMAAVRFGNVLGSSGSVIPIFLEQIKQGGPITLTDRNIKRYFMTIPEAVRLVLQTGALAESGEVFVLDMGEPVYIYDLACDLIRINGLMPEKDIEIKVTGLRAGEKLFEELRYDKETVNSTIHEGIFVTKLENKDETVFEKQLSALYKYAMEENEEKTIDTIFEIVPNVYRNMAVDDQIKSKEFESQGARHTADNIINESGQADAKNSENLSLNNISQNIVADIRNSFLDDKDTL